MKYKAGDLVRCVDNEYYEHQLTQGKTYKVIDCTDRWVYIDHRMTGGWNPNRFELVKEGVSMHKFKVGDVAKIVGAEDGNLSKWDDTEGFSNTWIPDMDYNIGQTARIIEIDEIGIRLDTHEHFRYPPQALEIYTEEMKIQKDKKYRVVGTHEPVRIICTDKASKLQCVALYTDHRGEEGLLLVSDSGLNCWGVTFIEEVPEIDWSKVVIDTPIWIGADYQPRHFAEFKNNFVYYYTDGRSSHTSNGMVAASKSFAALTNPNEKA